MYDIFKHSACFKHFIKTIMKSYPSIKFILLPHTTREYFVMFKITDIASTNLVGKMTSFSYMSFPLSTFIIWTNSLHTLTKGITTAVLTPCVLVLGLTFKKTTMSKVKAIKNSDFSFSWSVCEKQENTENMLRKILVTKKMRQNLISFEG